MIEIGFQRAEETLKTGTINIKVLCDKASSYSIYLFI